MSKLCCTFAHRLRTITIQYIIIMDKQKKQPNIKVNFSQAGKDATFRLTEKEYKLLKNASKKDCYETWGMMYNFSAFAWADYGLSTSKRGRFNAIFNYHKGDVMWEKVD